MLSFSDRHIILASGIFAITAITAFLWQQPLLFFLPAAFLAAFLLLQHPAYILYLLAALIPWSAEVNVGETLATDVPDEPLMLLASVAAMVLLVKNRNKLHICHPLLVIVGLQFIWMLLTVAASSVPLFSVKYSLAKSWYLLSFLVLPVLLNDFNILKRTAIVLTISTLVVTLVIVIRHAGFQFQFARINDAVSPFFRNHVVYSALLVFVVPLLWMMRHLTSRKNLRKLITILLCFAGAALFFSYARGAWLALVAGAVAYSLLRKQLLLKTFLYSIVIILIAVFWLQQDDHYLTYAHNYQTTIFHEDFEEHLAATYEGKDVSTAERFYRWIAGMRMVPDHWLTGTGPSTFYSNYKSYTVPLFRTWVSDNSEKSTVHNYFLLTLIEQGLIGFLLLLFLVGISFYYAEKIYHSNRDNFIKTSVAAIAAILVMQCVVNFLSDLVETDKAGSVFYLSLAALILLSRHSDKNIQKSGTI